MRGMLVETRTDGVLQFLERRGGYLKTVLDMSNDVAYYSRPYFCGLFDGHSYDRYMACEIDH